MPTRKLGEAPPATAWGSRPCIDPDHDPATMIVREPGIYEHECPTCRRRFTFTVQTPSVWGGLTRSG